MSTFDSVVPAHINANSTMEVTTEAHPSGELTLFAKVLVSLQVIQMVVIVSGNLLVLTAILNYRRLRDVTGIFVANLALADLILGMSLPFQMAFFFFPELEKNKFACLIRFEVIVFVCDASIMSLMCTVLDRYIAIAFPMKYFQILTNQKAYIVVGCIWMADIVLASVPLFGANNWFDGSFCLYELVMEKGWRAFNSIMGLLFAFCMFVIYVKIFLIVRKHLRQIQIQNIGVPTVEAVDLRRTQQMNTVVAIVVIFFHISWLPFLCIQMTMLDIENVTETKILVANLLVPLGIMNSMVNPFIYAVKNKQYRTAFKKLLRFKSTDNNTSALTSAY